MKVEQRIYIKIDNISHEIPQEVAEEIYAELGKILRKKNFVGVAAYPYLTKEGTWEHSNPQITPMSGVTLK